MPGKSALNAAILVVSTTAAKDPASDAADATLRDVFAQDGGRDHWTVVDSKIVGDVESQIQRQIMQWTDDASDSDSDKVVNLIVTTGGTGFAVADRTPEAVAPLLHRQAPGLVHGMLAASLAVTPFAMMSRPVAGVRSGTVIITLPGSPKGAKENLQAVIKMLPHACLQAAGGNSRAMHAGGLKKLEQEAGVVGAPRHQPPPSQQHHHHHHHDHGHTHGHSHGHGGLVRHTAPSDNPKSNDPSLGPSRRHRESPYPMLSVEDALELIKQHTPAPETTTAKVDPSLVGMVLAEDVTANENVPAFRASIVDGYAVVVPADGNLKGVFPVTAISHAAAAAAPDDHEKSTTAPLKEGEIARITTGAPLTPGATSVIMVEDTILTTLTDDGKEEKEVEILADNVKQGENIREVGSDIRAGAVILQKGDQISSSGGELGLLAAVGVPSVRAYRRPVVGVLSTGDEIIDHAALSQSQSQSQTPTPLRYGQVRDTNRPTLLSAIATQGYEAIDLGIASDKPSSLEETLRRALRQTDVVITTGGVSMGELDLLKPTIERSLGGTIHFGRVAMKPGKPTTFATIPSIKNVDSGGGEERERVKKVVFSLPGNPASALVTFHLFVLPSLRRMTGIQPAGLPRVPVVLAHDFPLDRTRPEYHRAIVSVTKEGTLSAASTGGQRSSRVGSMKGANALLCMPSGPAPLPRGSKVDAMLMGDLRV